VIILFDIGEQGNQNCSNSFSADTAIKIDAFSQSSGIAKKDTSNVKSISQSVYSNHEFGREEYVENVLPNDLTIQEQDDKGTFMPPQSQDFKGISSLDSDYYCKGMIASSLVGTQDDCSYTYEIDSKETNEPNSTEEQNVVSNFKTINKTEFHENLFGKIGRRNSSTTVDKSEETKNDTIKSIKSKFPTISDTSKEKLKKMANVAASETARQVKNYAQSRVQQQSSSRYASSGTGNKASLKEIAGHEVAEFIKNIDFNSIIKEIIKK